MQRQDFGQATLYLADAYTVLPEIIAQQQNSAAVLLTDPPYKMAMGGGGIGKNRSYLRQITDVLDGGFDVELLGSFNNWFVFCSKDQLVSLIGQAEKQGLRWQILTWNKRNPTPLVNRNYLPDTEYMIHAFVSHDWESKTRFVVGNVEKSPFAHPTVKPLYVMIKAVLSCSAKGDVLIDAFMGTGSTGVAALQLGRRFVGIEREPEYFDIACQRIERALAQGVLFEMA